MSSSCAGSMPAQLKPPSAASLARRSLSSTKVVGKIETFHAFAVLRSGSSRTETFTGREPRKRLTRMPDLTTEIASTANVPCVRSESLLSAGNSSRHVAKRCASTGRLCGVDSAISAPELSVRVIGWTTGEVRSKAASTFDCVHAPAGKSQPRANTVAMKRRTGPPRNSGAVWLCTTASCVWAQTLSIPTRRCYQ
jgi:hypothetical protein